MMVGLWKPVSVPLHPCSVCGRNRLISEGLRELVCLMLVPSSYKSTKDFWLGSYLFKIDEGTVRVLPQFGGHSGELLCGQCITVIERDYVVGLEYSQLPLYIGGRLVCDSSEELVMRRLRSGV